MTDDGPWYILFEVYVDSYWVIDKLFSIFLDSNAHEVSDDE
jgi:hypothetical protein